MTAGPPAAAAQVNQWVGGAKLHAGGQPAAPADSADLITAGTYAFASSAGVSLVDMSSGTTQLVASAQDDTVSAVTNIGFDLWYDGVRATQFSVNPNGLMRLGPTVVTTDFNNNSATVGFNTTTNAPKVAPFFDDLCTGTNGKVHYKLLGSAPNRQLVVEWQNVQVTRGAGCSGAGGGTFQAWLFETTGVVKFVYGAGMVATQPTDGGYSIGLQSGAATNFASVTTTGNTVSYAAANNAQTNAIPSGSAYTFTPNVPSAPTALNFTGTSALATTLNWTDNSGNEIGFAVYRSTDNVNFTFISQTAANATSFPDSGLSPGTQYFYKVYAASEGALSGGAQNSVTTSPAGNVSSTGAGGNWSSPATWAGGVIPANTDNVTIANGTTVTIDTAAVAYSLTVGTGGSSAALQWEPTTARTLTVGTSVTIASNGIFQSATTGTQTGHVLSVGGNLTNNGNLNFSTNLNTAGAGITFTGAANATFAGSGTVTDVLTLTVNKGTDSTSVLELMPANFTVQGVNTDVAGFLTLSNGTLKISGTFTATNRIFASAAYTIGATAGLWLNNPNFTVAGQNGSPATSGLLRIAQGTFNIGTATGNSMGFNTGSTITVEGGAINATGRFGVAASGNAIAYDQSGGTITVCTIGNASTTLASFDLGTGVGTTTISGGTIVVQIASTAASGPRDYRNQSGLTGTTTVTAGTLQLGNAASGAAQAFDIAGVIPNLVISNTSANHTATFLAPAVFNNVTRNVTINTGTTLNIGNNVFLMNGTTLTNNGTLTANGASSNFVWFQTTAPVTYTGTGTVTAPVTNMALQADQGVTFNAASPNIVVGAVRLFTGSVTNANKLTIGNGGATTGVVQIGNTTTPTAAGSFDVPFTFNLGTGGQTLTYLRTTAARSTGSEVNPTRTVTTMTYDDNDASHSLTISGGNLAIATTLTLTNGRVVTGANTLDAGTATVTRTNGYVDGNLKKTWAAAAGKTFEVGTANGYAPFVANVTAGTFPSSLTVKETQGTHPGFLATKTLQRYWTLTESGDLTADLTFNYLDPTDVPGTANENNFVLFRGVAQYPGATVNTAGNSASATGVSSFSDWVVAEPQTPTGVLVRSFSAVRSGSTVALRWRSTGAAGIAGFEVYRGETRLSRRLVASYRFVDHHAPRAAVHYRLRVVLLDGKRFWAASARVGARR